jgi:hypothetical protein
LRHEGVLSDDKKTLWFLQDSKLLIKNINTKEFTKYNKKIKGNKKLEVFLRDNLPTKTFEEITRDFSKEDKKKDNKTNTKTDSQELDKQDKKLDCTLTEEQKKEFIIKKKNSYWHSIIKQIKRMAGKENKKPDLEVIVNRESATINSYRACGCPKCKTVLKDGNLIKVDEWIILNK